VRAWLEMDNTIRTLQECLRERKQAKRALTARIVAFMNVHNIPDFSTRQGDHLAFRVSYVRAPLTQHAIRSRIVDYCAANALAAQQPQLDAVVFGNRERCERASLRRTRTALDA
jgi:short subunit dehydrogenase-like uncharacterized protein